MNDIQKIKLLLDYNNFVNECRSNNTNLTKDVIREYFKGSYYHQPIKI